MLRPSVHISIPGADDWNGERVFGGSTDARSGRGADEQDGAVHGKAAGGQARAAEASRHGSPGQAGSGATLRHSGHGRPAPSWEWCDRVEPATLNQNREEPRPVLDGESSFLSPRDEALLMENRKTSGWTTLELPLVQRYLHPYRYQRPLGAGQPANANGPALQPMTPATSGLAPTPERTTAGTLGVHPFALPDDPLSGPGDGRAGAGRSHVDPNPAPGEDMRELGSRGRRRMVQLHRLAPAASPVQPAHPGSSAQGTRPATPVGGPANPNGGRVVIDVRPRSSSPLLHRAASWAAASRRAAFGLRRSRESMEVPPGYSEVLSAWNGVSRPHHDTERVLWLALRWTLVVLAGMAVAGLMAVLP